MKSLKTLLFIFSLTGFTAAFSSYTGTWTRNGKQTMTISSTSNSLASVSVNSSTSECPCINKKIMKRITTISSYPSLTAAMGSVMSSIQSQINTLTISTMTSGAIQSMVCNNEGYISVFDNFSSLYSSAMAAYSYTLTSTPSSGCFQGYCMTKGASQQSTLSENSSQSTGSIQSMTNIWNNGSNLPCELQMLMMGATATSVPTSQSSSE